MKVNQALSLFLWLSNFCVPQVNAVYITDMVRLYRGEGDFTEAAGTGKTLTPIYGTAPTFTSDTPYGSTSRQVFTLNVSGNARTDGTGLPSGTSHRTMMGWFKAFDGHGYRMVPFGYGQMTAKQAFNAYSLGQVMYFDWTGFGDTAWDNSPITFTNNVWYHYALTYDGTTLRAYLNGELKRSQTISLETSTFRFTIGSDSDDGFGGNPWIGSIADVAVFAKALTQTEIQTIYNAPEGLTYTPCSANSDCTSTYCGEDGACTDGSNGSSCLDAQSCISTFCAGTIFDVCTDGQIGTVCFFNADCDTGLECDSAICKASVGTTCSGGSDCVSGLTCLGTGQVCTDGTNGSACDSTTDCTSSLTCLSTSLVCTDSANNSVCDSWNDCTSGICAASACSATCTLGSDCQSGYCVGGTCTTGALNANCGTGSDCQSGICGGGTTCTNGANGDACGSGSECTSGYCSPTPNICATRPILDPCHGISCSNAGKCKGNGVCQCENTFIQTNNGKDCECPDGSFLDTPANRCYAPTSTPTSSPTSLPVTSSPSSSTAPSSSPSNIFEIPTCENDSSYKFQLKRVSKEVGCSWISKNKRRVEKRRSKYCTQDFDDGALVNACQKSCNLCTV